MKKNVNHKLENDINFRNEILSLAECNQDISFTEARMLIGIIIKLTHI